MFLALITFFSGLAISAVAIYYSVIGLAAIFAAAVIPIIVMGTILEVSKLVAAWWLKANWHRAPFLLKSYMLVAVVVLMLITSMGIFGFLSKAHTEQAVPVGDNMATIQIIDERIAIEQEVIAQARQDIDVLNQQIERFTELGAVTRGVNARNQQREERQALTQQVIQAQERISEMRAERAPFAASLRAIEAEVGPIKYIAKLIYGDSTDANMLEQAVVWIIIVIVFVFDPLAVLLLLASQLSFQWARQEKDKQTVVPIEQPVENTEQDVEEFFQRGKLVARGLDADQEAGRAEEANALIDEIEREIPEVILPKVESTVEEKIEPVEAVEEVENPDDDDHEDFSEVSESEKAAMIRWKANNTGKSVKFQRKLLARGVINQLPWAEDVTEDEAAAEAVKWATEQIEESKKKTVTWLEKNGKEQIKRIREQ